VTRLLIARHGNTFDPGETVLRVGRRTDIPLSLSGTAQAERLGAYLAERYPDVRVVYAGPLKRARQTAEIAARHFPGNPPIAVLSALDEVDYGEDDGKPEAEAIARIGRDALERWETAHVPPSGWHVDPERIKEEWRNLVRAITGALPHETDTALCVTSNGTARFAPLALCPGDARATPLKLATGAFGRIDVGKDGKARLVCWGERP
jgi:broad specificity phosphatase PhoE